MNVEVVITSYKEPKTVAELVKTILKSLPKLKTLGGKLSDILVVAPDKPTLEAAKRVDSIGLVKTVQDKGQGKPAALDMILGQLKGDIVIFTDGDIKWTVDTPFNLLKTMLENGYDAVTGRPVPINSRNSLFGYWAWVTTQQGAHKTRLKLSQENKFINLSGYLFAIKREFLPDKIPHELLAEDVFISLVAYQKGAKLGYAPDALVYVMFPTNFRDWINQKKRAAGGDYQLAQLMQGVSTMRSFTKEASRFLDALLYARNLKELFWSFLLIFARLYMWILVFVDQKVLHKRREQIWVRIESTKEL